MISTRQFEVSTVNRSVPVFLVLLGVIAVAYGLSTDPDRTWPSLLLNGFYVTSLALSAMFFLATQRAAGARWSASLRRIPEAFMLALPIVAPLMLVLFFGREAILSWVRPGAFAHDPAIAGKVQYLQLWPVFARTSLALSLWIFFAWCFRKISIQQDREADAALSLHSRLSWYSVMFIPVFALTLTWTAYDWLVSLDPEWFSTMFAVYVFAGTFVQGIAAITLATVMLKERGFLGDAVGEHQRHDLGKMLFAFSTFWAYIWVCQYLLIWYSNIPEEVTHYIKRTDGPWLYFFALNFILNWVVPFSMLLSARAKCSPKRLKIICVVLLCGHWLDLYVLIMPALRKSPDFGLQEILIAAGYGALLYSIFIRNLARTPLVPVNDPILAADYSTEVVSARFPLGLVPGAEQ